jgi:hypothetical protein
MSSSGRSQGPRGSSSRSRVTAPHATPDTADGSRPDFIPRQPLAVTAHLGRDGLDDVSCLLRIRSLARGTEQRGSLLVGQQHADGSFNRQAVLRGRDGETPAALRAVWARAVHNQDDMGVGASGNLVDPEFDPRQGVRPASGQGHPQFVELLIPDLRKGAKYDPDVVNGHEAIIASNRRRALSRPLTHRRE